MGISLTQPKVGIILNPYAREGKGYRIWKRLRNSHPIFSGGIVFDGFFSNSTGPAKPQTLSQNLKSWLIEQYQRGINCFLAAGGDGTVNLALNSLIETRTFLAKPFLLGAIGLGSSNDFHKPFDSKKRLFLEGVPCRIEFNSASLHDVGLMTLNNEKKESSYFCVNASIGLTAEANHFFNHAGTTFRAVKRLSVNTAIGIAALQQFLRYKPINLQLSNNGQSFRPLRLTNLGVVKNPYFSGTFRYDLSQEPDDGLFGVHLCSNMNKPQTLKTLVALSKGKFLGLPHTESFKSTSIQVKAESDFAIETDGEVRRAKDVKFEVLPREVYLCP